MIRIEHHGGVSPTKIRNFELESGRKLPADYREFLQKYNGGIFRGFSCWIPNLQERVALNSLEGVTDGSFSLLRWIKEFGDELSKDELLLGDEACGNQFVLNCSKDFGGVYYYDRTCAHVRYGDTPMLYFVAFTFDEFLWNLKPYSESNTWPQILQWPDPLPMVVEPDTVEPRKWPRRKPAIWAQGEKSVIPENSIPEILRHAKLHDPANWPAPKRRD